MSLTADRTSFPVGWVVTHHALGQPCPPLRAPGAWTCLCGIVVYRDELLGPEFTGNTFVADAVYNCVHRKVVMPQGVLFRGDRARDEQHSEFLCSKDPWFRPATIQTGPDGALWVVDMYRFVIEHPQWINDDLEQTLELRLGHDKGRIYRVYPAGKRPRPIPRLDQLDTTGLVAALDSPSGWPRDMAQQLLLWRADRAAAKPLEELAARSARPLARLHALCTLDGLGLLRPEVVQRALADEHPGVRRHAVRLSESFLSGVGFQPAIPAAAKPEPHPALGAALLQLLDDPNPQVQMQLAYTLGQWRDERAGLALGRLALLHAADPYLEYIAVTTDGRAFSGMLLEETSNSIRLVDAAGKAQVILRKDLDELVCTGRSHMPERLGVKLTHQQMADLFAFIRAMKPTVRRPLHHKPELVQAEADGSLRLLAGQSEMQGAGLRYDAQQGCMVWLAGKSDQRVAWTFDVPQAATYEVSIETAQLPEYAGNAFTREAGANRLLGVFPGTGGWGQWQRNVYGRLALPAGRQRIVLRPNGPIKSELSDLRVVCLTPVAAGPEPTKPPPSPSPPPKPPAAGDPPTTADAIAPAPGGTLSLDAARGRGVGPKIH